MYETRLTMLDSTFGFRIGTGLLTGLILFIFLSNKRYSEYIRIIWKEKFPHVYYVSALVFAWLHIFNFELTSLHILLLPILTLPQLFSGLIMGYMRIRFGFLYPLFFHIITNSVLIGLDIILK